jgi:O-methyltransferase
MKHRDNCIIKKAGFPKPPKILRNAFCLSASTPICTSLSKGLVYFYPRLEKGGYIFVHDYNGDLYDGAKMAVRRFASEFNVPYVRLSDLCGSVVFSK